jgi:hypothetical protein
LIKAKGPKDTNVRREWLKTEYKLGTNTAWWLVDHAEGKDDLAESDPKVYVARAADYVDALFSGSKAALRPCYDRLYDLARPLGDDIKISPGKTIVPIYRKHVIAHPNADRLRPCPEGHARHRTPHRYRRVREEGPHHSSNRDHLTR